MTIAPTTDPSKVHTLSPRGQEVWSMQIPGVVYLRTLVHNRYGQLVEGEMAIGPNRVGHQFRISTEDREENQARVVDPAQDPFRNGILVRVDLDQQTVPETVSNDALTTEAILDIFDLPQAKFEETIKGYGEVPLRRMTDIGESMDVSHKKLDALRELIDERYRVGGPQPSMNGGKPEMLA